MDIGSAEENKAMNSENLGSYNQKAIGINGSDEGVKGGGDKALEEVRAKDDPVSNSMDSPSSIGSVGVSPQGTTKGKGLRKWRRIKREVAGEKSGYVDFHKALKRGSSNSIPNSTRPQGDLVSDTRQKSGGSLSSTGEMVRNLGGEANGDLDMKLVVGPNFAFGADSENSEDHSSISSTAASGSVLRNGVPMMAMPGLNEKNASDWLQRGQPRKARVKNSKKLRGGEQDKNEKENSLSSMESDSRSSNIVFLQGANSLTTNGRHGGKLANNGAENNDENEAPNVEEHFGGKREAGNNKGNGEGSDDLGHEDFADAENQCSLRNIDPLVESLSKLQSAQEALEKEIQKLKEIGDGSHGSTDQEIHEARPLSLFNPEEHANISPIFLEKRVNTLKRNANVSEIKLQEASTVLKANESMVTKLEYEEAEIEDLFRQKLEVEFEYLAISEAIQNLKPGEVDQVAVSDEKRSMLSEQRDGERRNKKLETSGGDTAETDQISQWRKRVSKVTLCLFIQLILLFVAIVVFLLQLSPQHAGVAPT